MSGRDAGCTGFGQTEVLRYYSKNAPLWIHPDFTRSEVNRLLSISASFRLDSVEMCNAFELLSRYLTMVRKHNHQPAADQTIYFFACVRLSVFWRKRRDPLTLNIADFRKHMFSRGHADQDILAAECELLTTTGCDVWESKHLAVEASFLVIRAIAPQTDSEESLRNVVVDLYLILIVSRIEGSRSELNISVWYVIPLYRSENHLCRELSLSLVVTACLLLTQTADPAFVMAIIRPKLIPLVGDHCHVNVHILSTKLLACIINSSW